jgi:hypothetical protein
MAGTGKARAVLTESEIGQFVADGFVAIRGAVPKHVAAACVDVVWAELGKLGVDREDRETWTSAAARNVDGVIPKRLCR